MREVNCHIPIKVCIRGRLTDAQEILFYTPGFSVTKFQVVNDNQVKATIKIAPDCRLGEHAMRIRSATGISELSTFWVGALPTIDEKEPNSDFTAPQKIPLNVTVLGVVDNEDVDYFAVQAKKGQRLSAEIEGMRLANCFAVNSICTPSRAGPTSRGWVMGPPSPGPGRADYLADSCAPGAGGTPRRISRHGRPPASRSILSSTRRVDRGQDADPLPRSLLDRRTLRQTTRVPARSGEVPEAGSQAPGRTY
jgi:hypothetical protein